MKPTISLYQTPNGFYFFDANKDEVVPVSDKSFEYLVNVMSDNEIDERNLTEELKKLKEHGYLK